MMTSVLLLVGGLIVLTFGAELLVRGGAALALRLKIRPLVVGLTVVAFGTSAPELAVSIKSALAGQGDVAAGNIIGSNIFNIAAILGLAALVFPLAVHAKLIRQDIPLMIAVTLVALFMMHDRAISRGEGALLFTGLITYLVVTFVFTAKEDSSIEKEADAELPKPGKHMLVDFALIGGGLAALVTGADWFVTGAVDLARWFGLSEAVIGLTIVAAGTSLPELATSVVASIRRHTDIAVGNVVGSNIFNILAILGMTGLVHPISTTGIVLADSVAMLTFALVLFPLAASGFVLKRWEGGLLLAGYVFYVWYRLNM